MKSGNQLLSNLGWFAQSTQSKIKYTMYKKKGQSIFYWLSSIYI